MTKKLLAALCLMSQIAHAQAPASSAALVKDSLPLRPFLLGEVVVTGEPRKSINSTLTAKRLQDFAKNDVSKAMNLLPGVHLSAVGPRNEAMVYVRGFDLRQVPLLIDGIPVYIPYDGYVDLARFTSFDLASIDVSKGYTSVLYGPNALGGAINLVTSKPAKNWRSVGPVAGFPAATGQTSISAVTWVGFTYRPVRRK